MFLPLKNVVPACTSTHEKCKLNQETVRLKCGYVMKTGNFERFFVGYELQSHQLS